MTRILRVGIGGPVGAAIGAGIGTKTSAQEGYARNMALAF